MKQTALEKQLTFFYNRKAKIEFKKFQENLKPKKLPFDRITMSILSGRATPGSALHELTKNYAGNKKLKNLKFSPEQAYLVYKELNEDLIPFMAEGKKVYL